MHMLPWLPRVLALPPLRPERHLPLLPILMLMTDLIGLSDEDLTSLLGCKPLQASERTTIAECYTGVGRWLLAAEGAAAHLPAACLDLPSCPLRSSTQ